MTKGDASANGDVLLTDTQSDTPTGDVLLGHNEDGDGFPDSIDKCPHVASATNADGDNDGVGDACDPEPTNGRQSWTLFAPMTSALTIAMQPANAWTLNADDYSYADVTNPSQIIYQGTISDIDVWVGFDVEAIGTPGIQAAIITNGMMVPYWYGELYDGGMGARISISEYDGTNYLARTQTAAGATFPLGAHDMYMTARVGGFYELRLDGLTTTFNTPAFTEQRNIIFAFGNNSGRVRYIAIVSSQ